MQALWRIVWKFLKKLKVELPCDPKIPLMGMYLEKIIIWKAIWTPVFIAALFTIAKFSSVQFSYSVVSDSLQPHRLQQVRPPCPSPTPGVYSNSCPLSRWCHPTISSCHPLHLLPSVFLSIRVFNLSQHQEDKQRRTKEPLDESERGEWKSWLKTQHSVN